MAIRIVSAENELKSRRLRKVVNDHKHYYKTNNRELAKVIGISEAQLSQYVNNHSNITKGALEKICGVLGIEPELIDPDFNQNPAALLVPVIGNMTNTMPLMTCTRLKIRKPKQGLVALESDETFNLDQIPGYIIVDTDTPPRPEDQIIYRTHNNAYYHQGILKEYMRDRIVIERMDKEMLTFKSLSELVWMVKIHEFYTVKNQDGE